MKNWFQRAYDWLAGFGKYLKDILLEIFTDAVKTFIDKMGPTIEEILKEIQADPSIIGDDERRKEAFDRIMEAAKKAGLETVKESVVYMVIEMILQALKNTDQLGTNVGAGSTKVTSKKKSNKKK